ncbi:MAG: hypothetical protein QW197_01310 [Candidatus Aenigmatarchaeota archaeon]
MCNIVYFKLFLIIILVLAISKSQVGISIEPNISLENDYKTHKIRIYSSNDSIVEMSYRSMDIFEVSTRFKEYLQNYSEQKDSIVIEFAENPIRVVGNEKISYVDSFFVVKKMKDSEPGYRIFYITATKVAEAQAVSQYSVSVVPSIEVPFIVFVDGLAIRNVKIKDVDVSYENNVAVLNVIVKNDGTVTTSFYTYLNISNQTLKSYNILKPNEIGIIKFPLSLYGKFNVSILVDYFSGKDYLEREVEIKKFGTFVLPKINFEIPSLNIFQILIIVLSIIVAIIIIKRKK